MNSFPPVAVIIPHYSGDVLLSCLRSLFSCANEIPLNVIVVDDSKQSDGNVERAKKLYPTIRVLKTSGGRGYGASCNLGLKNVDDKYAVLLNNDVEVTPGWLPPLIQAMEADPALGICQPKILSLRDRRKFDKGGGAGGMMDIFGYPFALGSLVHAVETDDGQYDTPRELFWAHGSAMVLRMSMLLDIGFFDEDFYMQIEEIDLCCRALLTGRRIRSVPASTVCHYFGWTLQQNSVQRHYLSHRNTIVLLLKNWPLPRLAWVFPLRIGLELLTIPYSFFFRRDWKQPLGVFLALGWILVHPLSLARKRKSLRFDGNYETLSERTFRGSILWAYFIRGIKTCNELLNPGGPR